MASVYRETLNYSGISDYTMIVHVRCFRLGSRRARKAAVLANYSVKEKFSKWQNYVFKMASKMILDIALFILIL